MKKSATPYAALIFSTFFLLGYVHGHTSIYRISYSIEAKERKVAELGEQFKQAKFRVSTLKSPAELTQRLKDTEIDLIVPKEHEIIKVLMRKRTITAAGRMSPRWIPFMTWFHLMGEAQAKLLSSEG
jgi:hypothetical protein